MELTQAQQRALDFVAAGARTRADGARQLIEHVARMSNLEAEAIEEARAAIERRAMVALHFHPDRPTADGTTILDGLIESGIYKSQFETGLSSGSVTAHAGGPRDEWERELFGGAYQADGVTAAERPKYGALALYGHAAGPAPRFGSCYILLRPGVLERCTFTFLDSHRAPVERGTLAAFDDIFAALLADAFERETVLGEPGVRPPEVIQQLGSLPDLVLRAAGTNPSRNLDHYIEVQVHGTVDLARDAALVVADGGFQGTEVDQAIASLCRQIHVPRRWTHGYQLSVDEVPSTFRGPTMPSLAARIAQDGRLSAYQIGRAARDLHADPEGWADRGTPAEVLQELKLMWHCLVRYGGPITS